MSGKGFGRIDRRRRVRHGQHGLRRLHEADRQRTASYNLGRGRLTPLVSERIARGARVQARKLRAERHGTMALVRHGIAGLAASRVLVDEERGGG